LKVLVYVVLLLGNLMESPMGQPHVIAPHVVGTEFFGHTVMLMRISRRKGKLGHMFEVMPCWNSTSAQNVDAWLSGVGFVKRTKQVKHASL
jgi:hypothetical protein